VKPQYRHVIIRSSWLGLNGAPHLVQLVGISLGVVGVWAAIGAVSIICGAATAGAGAGRGARGIDIVGDCAGAEGMDICRFLLASTSGLPPTATTPFNVQVLSSRCPSRRSPVNVGPKPAGMVIWKENC